MEWVLQSNIHAAVLENPVAEVEQLVRLRFYFARLEMKLELVAVVLENCEVVVEIVGQKVVSEIRAV